MTSSKHKRGAGVAEPVNVSEQEEVDIEPSAGDSSTDESEAEYQSEKPVRRSAKAPGAGPPVAKSLSELQINNPEDHLTVDKRLDVDFFFDRKAPTGSFVCMECR